MSERVTPSAGRLERLPVSSIWRDEAKEFTPWLAREENLRALSDEIQLQLTLEGIEKFVGPFRADLVCRDDRGRVVIIENQLTASDHRHLGQLMTYAAGLEAFALVWISEHFLPEHSAAIDWLNDMTTEHVDFYGLEIEAYRIGCSEPAPKFSIISRPNAWRKKRHKFEAETVMLPESHEPAHCLKAICEHVVFDRILQIPLPASDLILAAANLSDSLPVRDANRVLARIGIRVVGRGENANVLIANGHTGLERIFRETKWADGEWKAALRKLKGATAAGSFTFARHNSRAVRVPLSCFPIGNRNGSIAPSETPADNRAEA